MAKTIGKDKGSATRPRSAAAAETEPVGDPSNDEPRDEDIVVADDLDVVPDDAAESASDDGADDGESAGRDLIVPADGAVARRTSSMAISRPAGVPEPLLANPITRFMAESYLELRKVTWPTLNEAWNMTLIVIAMSAVVAIILGIADAGLIKALGWFLTVTHAGTAPAAAPTPTPAPVP